MADETERPIEKLLRAYAKKRREQAGEGFALHPANRRELQAEVARRFGSGPASRSLLGWWFPAGWPRLAWGLAAVGVVIVAAVFWLPLTHSKPELRLARNEPTAQPVPPHSPAPSARAGAGRDAAPSDLRLAETARSQSELAANREKKSQLADKDQSATTEDWRLREESKLDAVASAKKQEREANTRLAYSATAPAAVAPPAATAAPAPSVAQKEKASGPAAAGEGMAGASTTDAPTPALGLTLRSPQVAGSTGLLADNSVLRKQSGPYQFFADEAKPAKAPAVVARQFTQNSPKVAGGRAEFDRLATPPPVLNSFTLEQSGRELRVVDSDGSVYTGYLEVADVAKDLKSDALQEALTARRFQAPARMRELAAQSNLQALASNVPPSSLAYFFRVVGTNQTLKQPVVFSGNLLSATNQAPAALSAGALGGFGGGTAPAGSLAIQLPLPARISGTAMVGKEETKIEATARGTAQ